MYVCVVTACAHVLWPRPDIYCNYYVRAKFKPGGVPGCYDARGNTELGLLTSEEYSITGSAELEELWRMLLGYCPIGFVCSRTLYSSLLKR